MSEDGALKMLIAAEIRKLLFLRDMTMMQLAERAGMTQPYISRRLTGATTLDVEDLEKIADVLGVEVVDLLPAPSRASGQSGRHVTTQYADPLAVPTRQTTGRNDRPGGGRPPGRPDAVAPGRDTRRPVRLSGPRGGSAA